MNGLKEQGNEHANNRAQRSFELNANVGMLTVINSAVTIMLMVHVYMVNDKSTVIFVSLLVFVSIQQMFEFVASGCSLRSGAEVLELTWN